MKKYKSVEPDHGVLTNPMNVQDKEFKELQLFISKKVASLSEKEKINIELFALQIRIEDYLNSKEEEGQVITVGDFLRLYIDKLKLKQNKLAKYIGINPANFNKILSGSRKMNFELSFMLGHIFNLDPKAWMLIQVKNEYMELKKKKATYFQKYKLEDLISY